MLPAVNGNPWLEVGRREILVFVISVGKERGIRERRGGHDSDVAELPFP